jgi:thiamine biosynthesis lipoprotein
MALEVPRRSWVEQIMGMPISLLARGEAAARQDAAAQRVFSELREVDARFSLYREDSEVSRLSRGELRLEDCHDDVREVWELCSRAKQSTRGLFDVVTPRGVWDPSGLVKGWAAERAARHLAATEVDWCLSAGGDVAVVSRSGEPFTVGIQDPRDPTVVAGVLRTTQAVATSGTAARGDHIYDPATGAAVRSPWLSVSVTGESLLAADVMATAAFVAGEAWVDQLLPGYAGLAIGADGVLNPTREWGL